MRTNPAVIAFFSFSVFGGLSVQSSASQSASAGLGVVSNGFSFTLPDPKHPGKLLYELRAASANGQSQADGFHGTLSSVWGRLYQNGVATAILTAPRAQGGSVRKSVVVTGLGGVVVKSLTQPGTKLTADTVVWYASLNKMVATGHVFFHDGKTGAVTTAPRMVADTRLKTITVSGGGHATASL